MPEDFIFSMRCHKDPMHKFLLSRRQESHDDAPVVNVSDELVRALRGLIRLFSIQDMKTALAVEESDI